MEALGVWAVVGNRKEEVPELLVFLVGLGCRPVIWYMEPAGAAPLWPSCVQWRLGLHTGLLLKGLEKSYSNFIFSSVCQTSLTMDVLSCHLRMPFSIPCNSSWEVHF